MCGREGLWLCGVWLDLSYSVVCLLYPKCIRFAGFNQLIPMRSDVLDAFSLSMNIVIESLALINTFINDLQSCSQLCYGMGEVSY